jgi:carbamoyl-phosphate synthase large subunit
MNNILILSAGRRVELVKAFSAELAHLLPQARVWAADRNPMLSSACQVADFQLAVPPVTDPHYVDSLIELCVRHGIGLVIPTIDPELLPLSRALDRFAANGIHVVISDPPLVLACRDKRKTAQLFSALDIATPRIYPTNAIELPCFAKPFDGSCSVGATAVRTAHELQAFDLSDPRTMFMQFIDESHDEYTIDA